MDCRKIILIAKDILSMESRLEEYESLANDSDLTVKQKEYWSSKLNLIEVAIFLRKTELKEIVNN